MYTCQSKMRFGFLGCICVLLLFYVAFSAILLLHKVQNSSILNDLNICKLIVLIILGNACIAAMQLRN